MIETIEKTMYFWELRILGYIWMFLRNRVMSPI